jgi:2-(1,2-epoxy-1,2-dihydrophenyl)acetyl-CoA isomerase
VPSRVGFARAAEMAMLGERIPAPQALAWGLINRVSPDDAFETDADGLLERIAAGPTRAYAGAKRQLNGWIYGRMHEQLELEAAVQQELAGSEDFAEGVAAFVERRTAMFGGR